MGNCCTSENDKDLKVGFLKNAPTQYNKDYQLGSDTLLDGVLDEREVMGLKGSAKISIIVKI